MVEHVVKDGVYGKHITNVNVDTIETLIGYICNLENVNTFKILIGHNNIKAKINEFYDLESEAVVPLAKSVTKNKDGEEVRNLFTVKELSEKIRHRLYHIKNNDKEAEVFKELLSDINSMVDVKNNIFLVGIDKSKKNIDNIYNVIKESFDMLEITNYTIYVYEGVENGKKDNS